MSLKTRLDGRSAENASFQILDNNGNVIAEVTLLGNSNATLNITTAEDLFIQKPNGWKSK